MSSKLVDNKRRHHVDKVLQSVSKASKPASRIAKDQNQEAPGSTSFHSPREALADQYNLIREDLTKLKDDVFKGVNLAREMMGRKNILELLRSKV